MACIMVVFLSRQLASYALLHLKDVLGALPPGSILGGFSPICKVGAFAPKRFREPCLNLSHSGRAPAKPLHCKLTSSQTAIGKNAFSGVLIAT